eukprot:1986126-Karenia_brevis.AAC.1
MPTLARLHWALDQLKAGRAAILTITPALDPKVLKVRLRMYESYDNANIVKTAIAPIFEQVASMISQSSLVDRGHKHHAVCSDISFYATVPLIGLKPTASLAPT